MRWMVCVAGLVLGTGAWGWDAVGHRIVTNLAVESAAGAEGAGLPEWVREDRAKAQVADQSVVPDRWRSMRSVQLSHVNNPDHYLDMEDLEPLGLTLRTMPRLRYEFVRAVERARARADFAGERVEASSDPYKIKEYPGFLAHAMCENYAKLVSGFKVVRVLEALNDPGRRDQVEMARANVLATMGVLAHYAGDASQPLHTTKHFNGWVGPNPRGFTRDKGFHSMIDGGVIDRQGIDEASVRAGVRLGEVDPADPWDAVLAQIERSHALMEPLYELEKAGGLARPEGKAFVEERLADAAGSLGALYAAAYRESALAKGDVENFIKYDNYRPSKDAGAGGTKAPGRGE